MHAENCRLVTWHPLTERSRNTLLAAIIMDGSGIKDPSLVGIASLAQVLDMLARAKATSTYQALQEVQYANN